ncbi:hypothetical protein HDE_12253 [Halotydeus destructor]|nr:hypothetical protein HDE_12253 [Halotydeus destructor]
MLCLLGFFNQAGEIASSYFKYMTSTALAMEVPEIVDIPAFSVCWRYADIVDISIVKERANKTDMPLKSNMITEIQTLVTLESLFEASPSIHNLFDKCTLRFPGQRLIRDYFGRDCNHIFKVNRFYVQEYVCYRMQPRLNSSSISYRYVDVASSMSSPGMSFEMGFNMSEFDNAILLVPIIHRTETFPDVSIFFAPQLLRLSEKRKDKKNFFHLSHSHIGNHLLMAPYQTDCSYYTMPNLVFPRKQACYSDCLINLSLSEFSKFPFSVIIPENTLFDSNHKIVTNPDVQNETIGKKMASFEILCRQKCSKPNCEEIFTLTEQQVTGSRDDSIYFRIDLPRQPNFSVHHHPRVVFNEFALYILSCLGTWLGISVFALNPVNVIRKVKQLVRHKSELVTHSEMAARSRSNTNEILYDNRVPPVLEKIRNDIRLIKMENSTQNEQIKYLLILNKRGS